MLGYELLLPPVTGIMPGARNIREARGFKFYVQTHNYEEVVSGRPVILELNCCKYIDHFSFFSQL